MKHLLISGLAALSLAACATGPSAYGPAAGSSSLGFKNTQIEKDRFRISYTGRSREEARDYALLRAAEIAINEGYSHFKVIGGGGYDNGPSAPVSSRIGIGFGNGYYGRGRSTVNLGIGIHDVARALEGNKATETMEVILLRSGGSRDDGNIYNAKSISERIRPEVFQ